MNTIRISVISLFLMLATNVVAQKTVTIDFDNDYQMLFPYLPGVSCSANKELGIEASNEGDFQGASSSTSVDGVTVTVTASDDAKTPNRIWFLAPRLRMYSGTFTVTAQDITKIEFTASNAFYLSTNTGTLDFKVWVGQADEVVFDIAKNTQINKIIVTFGGTQEVIDPNKNGTKNNPYTVDEAQELLATMAVNVKSDTVYVKGFITQIDEIDDTGLYGNATYYINDTKSTDGQLCVFRGYYLDNTHFTSTSQIAVGDEVIVTGQLVNYRSTKAAETDPYTPEFTQGNYIYSYKGKSLYDGVDNPDNPYPNGQCTTPTIIIAGNKVRFECETPGAEFISTLTTEEQFAGNEVLLGDRDITFTITVYATAPNYSCSKPASVKIIMNRGDVNRDGMIGIGDIVEITNIMSGKE